MTLTEWGTAPNVSVLGEGECQMLSRVLIIIGSLLTVLNTDVQAANAGGSIAGPTDAKTVCRAYASKAVSQTGTPLTIARCAYMTCAGIPISKNITIGACLALTGANRLPARPLSGIGSWTSASLAPADQLRHPKTTMSKRMFGQAMAVGDRKSRHLATS